MSGKNCMTRKAQGVAIGDVMTRRLRTGERTQGLLEIWKIFEEDACHHLPIVENGRPVGIVTSTDLIRVARRHGATNVAAGLDGDETADQIMSTALETIHVADSVDTAIDRIGRGDIHALLVVDDEENLVGIVTHRDLLHYVMG